MLLLFNKKRKHTGGTVMNGKEVEHLKSSDRRSPDFP